MSITRHNNGPRLIPWGGDVRRTTTRTLQDRVILTPSQNRSGQQNNFLPRCPSERETVVDRGKMDHEGPGPAISGVLVIGLVGGRTLVITIGLGYAACKRKRSTHEHDLFFAMQNHFTHFPGVGRKRHVRTRCKPAGLYRTGIRWRLLSEKHQQGR